MRRAVIPVVIVCVLVGYACTSVDLPQAADVSTPPTDSSVVDSSLEDSPQTGPSSEDATEAEVDLNGFWEDNERVIRITQTGTQVIANYVETYVCDHNDGPVPPGEAPDGTAETSDTDLDFHATLDGNQLTGETNVCNWETGEAVHELGAGLMLAPIELTVSADGSELIGTWYNEHDDTDEPILITRLDGPAETKVIVICNDEGADAQSATVVDR